MLGTSAVFLKKLTYPTLGLLFVGLVLSLVTHNNVWKQEKGAWSQKIEQEAMENTLILAGELEVIERELMGIVSLYNASEMVTRSGFKTYVTPLLKRQGFARAFLWIPRVFSDQRPILESLARNDGFHDFQFLEQGKALGQGKAASMRPAAPRDEYFPIYYVEPYVGNESILGFDTGTRPELWSYIAQSRDSGQTTATHARRWFDGDQKKQILIFAPFYAGDGVPETIEMKKRLFRGTVLGIYRVGDMMDQMIRPYMVQGLSLSVFDEGGMDPGNRIHGTPLEKSPLNYRSLLNFSGRRWNLLWQGTQEFQNGPNRAYALWLSVIVFAFIAFIAVIFQMMATRTRQVENEVTLRTEELTLTNEQLHQLKNQLEQQNLTLSELNETKNRLLGMASHDLRNPLTSIQGYSKFLLSKGNQLDEEARGEFLDIIHSASGNMLALVNDLLNLSVIHSGQLTLNPQPGSIGKLIRERVRLYDYLAQGKNIKLQMGLADVPEFSFDAQRIGQVIDNLLSNAVKFSPTGGCIHVKLERVNEHARVSIRDEGAGVKKEEQDKLFHPFGKISSRPTGGESGTGLGLAIAKKMIDVHHGKLKVHSEAGKGAEFSFELPLT